MNDGSAISLDSFLRRFRKGSRSFRNILDVVKKTKIKIWEIRNVVKISNLVNIDPGGESEIKHILRFWGLSFLPMNLREFSFKFFNNSLGLNQRLAHFVAGQGPGCTFCTITNNGPIPLELFRQFFFDCPKSSSIRTWFENNFMPDIVFNNREEQLRFWFYGILPQNGDQLNIFILILAQCFLYSLWKFKLQKRLPVKTSFQLEFFYTLEKIISASRIVREQMHFIDIYLCRNWDNIRHWRG